MRGRNRVCGGRERGNSIGPRRTAPIWFRLSVTFRKAHGTRRTLAGLAHLMLWPPAGEARACMFPSRRGRRALECLRTTRAYVPDVSFPGSYHDGYYGCYAAGGGDCGAGRFYFFFGTSGGTPSTAAVAALLNQRMGGSQGNLNPLLYRLASSSPNSFHDATPATINGTVCSLGTPSICNNSTPGPNGPSGYWQDSR